MDDHSIEEWVGFITAGHVQKFSLDICHLDAMEAIAVERILYIGLIIPVETQEEYAQILGMH